MTATVAIGTRDDRHGDVPRPIDRRRSRCELAMPDLLRQVPAGAERDLAYRATGTGRLYYTARLQYAPTEPPPATDQGMRVERRYERFVENGDSPAGDDVRGRRSRFASR